MPVEVLLTPPAIPDDCDRLGLLSDTHDLLHGAVLDIFAGCREILHAGDVCDPRLLEELEYVAPVRLVAGNNDVHPLVARAGLTKRLDYPFGALGLAHGHWLADGALYGPRRHPALVAALIEPRPNATPASIEPLRVVVYGHTHRPLLERDDEAGLWFVNPGSAAWPRGEPEPTVALLDFPRNGGALRAIHHVQVPDDARRRARR